MMKMYLIKAIPAIALVSMILLSCNPDVEIPKQEQQSGYTMLYMPQAEGGVKNYTFDINQATDQIVLGAAYGGMGSVNTDMNVSIKVDPSLVNAYNDAKGTQYETLPEGSYSVSGTDVVIQRGVFTSTPIKVLIQIQAMIPFKEYMLAAKIESTDAQIPTNEKLKEAFFVVKTSPSIEDYPVFDRANWTVESFSTEEPKEATWGNGGQVIHTIDGSNSTFWHSKWDGGEAPPPHWFVIDMGETRSMHGLKFLGRQNGNSGKPKDVTVELSTDGTNWIPGGSFELQNSNDLQTQFLIDGFNTQARYFKVTVASSYNANYTHLAEINAY